MGPLLTLSGTDPHCRTCGAPQRTLQWPGPRSCWRGTAGNVCGGGGGPELTLFATRLQMRRRFKHVTDQHMFQRHLTRQNVHTANKCNIHMHAHLLVCTDARKCTPTPVHAHAQTHTLPMVLTLSNQAIFQKQQAISDITMVNSNLKKMNKCRPVLKAR